jgi:hypothetical protein
MKRYYVETFDNIVGVELQAQVWEYLLSQEYWAPRKIFPHPNQTITVKYIPNQNKKEYLDESIAPANNQFMHRCPFATNDEELKNHPIILDLWNTLNSHFNNRFEINGNPEPAGDRRARAYVNIQPHETIKRTHTIHRDTSDLTETKNYTMLYIANPEWHPSWFAENIYYEDDDNSTDKQQYQQGYGQSRGFGIGNSFLTVHPTPGKVILYDGRTLHTTKPAAVWAPEMRYAVAFRIREK